jgi:hypothetical protein
MLQNDREAFVKNRWRNRILILVQPRIRARTTPQHKAVARIQAAGNPPSDFFGEIVQLLLIE